MSAPPTLAPIGAPFATPEWTDYEMTDYMWLPVLGGIVCFAVAFGIGANDVANSFASAFGCDCITVRSACIIAAIMEFAGALALGGNVTKTIRKGIVSLDFYEGDDGRLLIMAGMFCALIGAATWLILATRFSLPVSTTHTTVGAVLGFAIATAGYERVSWETIIKIIASWFISPILSALVSAGTFVLINHLTMKRADPVKAVFIVSPVLWFLTVFIVLLFVLYKGAKNLKLDLSLDIAMTVSVCVGVGAALFAFLVLRPIQLKLIKDGYALRKHARFALVSQAGQGKVGADPRTSVDPMSKASQIVPTSSATQLRKEDDGKEGDGVTEGDGVDQGEKAYEANKNAAPMKEDPEPVDPVQQYIDGMSDDEKVVAHAHFGFDFLIILACAVMSFAHGANDVANAIGPFAGLMAAYKEQVSKKAELPVWILALGGIGIVVGLFLWGRKVMYAVGKQVTSINPVQAFAVQISAIIVVLFCTRMKMPVSTTHCCVGAVVGAGLTQGTAAVSWRMFGRMASAWLVTVPAGALVSVAFLGLVRPIVLRPISPGSY